MIELLRQGTYRLLETKNNTKILYLDKTAYAWLDPAGIGEILVTVVNPLKTDCLLSVGGYRLYRVEHEPYLSDLMHLELEYGPNLWQGYLLLTGLPMNRSQKKRIIPTGELITSNPRFKRKLDNHQLSKVN